MLNNYSILPKMCPESIRFPIGGMPTNSQDFSQIGMWFCAGLFFLVGAMNTER